MSEIQIIAVAMRLENVTFHFNPKEGQCQRMFKVPYSCAHYTCRQGYAQNPSSQASAIHELITSRCSSWVWKRQGSQRSNCQHSLNHKETKGLPEKKKITSAPLTTLKPLTVQITTYWKILKEKGSNRPLYLLPEKPLGRSRSNGQN